MGFPRQEYWSRLPFPSPGDLPDPGMESTSPESSALQTNSLPLSQQGTPLLALIAIDMRPLKKTFICLAAAGLSGRF